MSSSKDKHESVKETVLSEAMALAHKSSIVFSILATAYKKCSIAMHEADMELYNLEARALTNEGGTSDVQK